MRNYLYLIILFFAAAVCGPGTAHGLTVHARSAILVDMNATKILYKKNIRERIAPASLTKVMTLYLAYEAIENGKAKFGDMVPISYRADATGGSSMNAVTGTRIPLIELMKGMAVVSGNDACVAVAEYLGGGSVKKFVKMMNAKARELGMKNTVFKNPNGLPARGQVTTAEDMYILGFKYIKRFPQSLRIHKMRYYKGNGFQKKNRNRLLGTCYGVDGLKTGYVYSSKYNVITTAERDGRRLLGVVMGARTAPVRAKEMRKLIEMGYGGDAKKPPKGKLDPIFTAAVVQPPKTIPLSEAVYTLQESSFKKSKQAKDRVEDLTGAGVAARVVAVDLGKKGTWHRVMVGGFESLDQAKKYRKYLSDSHELDHIIILKTDKLKKVAVTKL